MKSIICDISIFFIVHSLFCCLDYFLFVVVVVVVLLGVFFFFFAFFWFCFAF